MDIFPKETQEGLRGHEEKKGRCLDVKNDGDEDERSVFLSLHGVEYNGGKIGSEFGRSWLGKRKRSHSRKPKGARDIPLPLCAIAKRKRSQRTLKKKEAVFLSPHGVEYNGGKIGSEFDRSWLGKRKRSHCRKPKGARDILLPLCATAKRKRSQRTLKKKKAASWRRKRKRSQRKLTKRVEVEKEAAALEVYTNKLLEDSWAVKGKRLPRYAKGKPSLLGKEPKNIVELKNNVEPKKGGMIDLDDETKRVWKLGKGVGPEERNTFRGRAESFIARTSPIQGDRRFIPWQGSVVDSVMGVILTHNTSDHLSSSAFMSLAEKFPGKREKTIDSVDWESVRTAHISEVEEAIKMRGINRVGAKYIKGILNELFRENKKIDLEWLRSATSDEAEKTLLGFKGIGLKSAECVRLLTLHQPAFPVDVNIQRIVVRLGWFPLRSPLSLDAESYPEPKSVHDYLWPRLDKLDHKILYELHYQMITFGKVFCKAKKPNCKACPMRGECRYFASAVASGTEKPQVLLDIEDIGDAFYKDAFYEDPEEMPISRRKKILKYNKEQDSNMSTSQGRTEVYELDDGDPLLAEFEKREEHGDAYLYLLAIWPPDGTNQRRVSKCNLQEIGKLCDKKTCLSCFVRGTILIPHKTALRSTFPLNGTFFQINEVFADHDSSLNPISIPRDKLRGLRKRNVFFGTSIFSMLDDLSTEAIQQCFVKGSICFRGFDRKTTGSKPLQDCIFRPANKRRSHVPTG